MGSTAPAVRLPLGDPPVHGYLFHAYPLSILAARADYLPWLYSTFIQLYHLPGGELKLYVHPLSPGPCLRHAYFTTCPWLDVQALDQSLLMDSCGLVPFLRACLDRGLYPQVDLDYRLLPGRSGGDPSPFLHEVLLSGYDSSGGCFDLTAFDETGRFGPCRIPFGALEAAAAAVHVARTAGGAGTDSPELRAAAGPAGSPRSPTASAPDDPGWLGSDPEERPRLLVYRYVAGARFRLDPQVIADQLADYLNAANTSLRYRAVAPPVDGLWGMGVYAYLMAALVSLAERRGRRPRRGLEIPLRIFWEHKRLMARRLAFLEGSGHLDPARQLSVRAAALADAAQQARLVTLRWRRTCSPQALEVASALLQQIASAEYEVLDETVAHLGAGCAPSTDQRAAAGSAVAASPLGAAA